MTRKSRSCARPGATGATKAPKAGAKSGTGAGNSRGPGAAGAGWWVEAGPRGAAATATESGALPENLRRLAGAELKKNVREITIECN